MAQKVSIKSLMKKLVMVKRPILVFITAVVFAGGVYAQEAAEAATPKNKFTLTLDAAQLFRGIIASDSDSDTSHFGLGAVLEFDISGINTGVRADLGISDLDGTNLTYFDILALWRFYPLAQLTKLYLSTELGFSYEKLDVSGSDAVSGLVFGLRAGWKQQFNKIFIDTSMGYGYSKDSMGPFGWHGWQAGLGIGFAF
jgi:hypothetical protein